MQDPFHDGERAVQNETGERGQAIMNSRVIADHIPAAAVHFVSQQLACIIGGAAPNGDLWAGCLAGPAGFAASSDEGTRLDLRLVDEGGLLRRTPPFADIRVSDSLGVLFIETATRRRLRVNGQVASLSGDLLRLSVAEAFPNCPKYIQRREAVQKSESHAPLPIREGEHLDDDLLAWIAAADTFFVASAQPGNGPVDASHRGGRPGFVRADGNVLHIPDYPGNSMFGTLGNFAVNPRAGLVFIDFETSRQLHLTGAVMLDLSGGPRDHKTGGTGRWWRFTAHKWIVSPLNHTVAWTFIDASPFNP